MPSTGSATGWSAEAARAGDGPWPAAAPALLLVAILLVAALAYGLRCARRGPFLDEETESRGESALLGRELRRGFAWSLQPVWRAGLALRLSPDGVTLFSAVLAALSGMAVAHGHFVSGGWLYLLAGACDFVDGRLARLSGRASRAGAALDSTLDRYAETFVLVGLGWYYRDGWMLLVVLAALSGSFLVPYVRARGEGLGLSLRGGLMQRPERVVLLGASLAFSPLLDAVWPPAEGDLQQRLVLLGLLLLALGSHATALLRLRMLRAALREADRRG